MVPTAALAAALAVALVACAQGGSETGVGGDDAGQIGRPDARTPSGSAPDAAPPGIADASPSPTPTPSPDGAPVVGSPDAAPTPPPPPPDAGPVAPPPPPACGDGTTGDFTISLTHAGLGRSAYVHLPAGYAATPTPVVLAFHGYGSTSGIQRAFTAMDAAADRDGYIAVYPEGIGAPTSFNGGACCGIAAAFLVDDVGFTRALLDALAARVCVDARRVFATGYSNGAVMAHRLGCELADRIAAIAPVAGPIAMEPCANGRPISVLDFHGTADQWMPYLGGGGSGLQSVPATIDGWAARNGCGAPAVSFAAGLTTCELRACAAGSEVELCTSFGAGATWPGGSLPIDFGFTSFDVDATARMWQFFARHPMP